MLHGVEEQARHTIQQLIDIHTLVNEVKEAVKSIDSIRYSEEFVMSLFYKPSFTIASIEKET